MDTQTPQPTQPTPDTVDFMDQLLEEKFAANKEDLTPEIKQELKRDLIKQMDNFVMASVLDRFSNEEVREFEKLIKEGKTREELQEFAQKRIPDFSDFVANILVEFQTVYLNK
jgi:hypothetical protein